MSTLTPLHIELFALAFYAICVLVVGTVIYQERDPSTTLAWVLVFIVFPVVGLVLYLFFGRNLRLSARKDRLRQHAEALGERLLEPLYVHFAEKPAQLTADTLSRRVSRAIRSQVGTEPLPCVDLEIFSTGAEKFERLYRDIEAATDHVHLEYFIWENDELTARFCELLARKLTEGVEVRVLYDWFGSLFHSKAQLRSLKAAGAEVYADAARLFWLNYRNHRKLVVIDRHIAYTGGMNFGKEYVDGGRRFDSWRDTAVRFRGPLVAEVQRLFAARWMRTGHEDLFTGRYFPQPEDWALDGRVCWAQMAYSGPESRWEAIRQTYLLAIASATGRVRVQSPYFVPDQATLDVLVSQALAGVEVEFMMTGVADKRIPWWAAFSYIDDLLEAGGTVYQYDAGFFHPKTLTIDGEIAVIGTTNIDIRSFSLHDELSIFFYDEQVTSEVDAMFAADLDDARAVSAEEVSGLGPVVRFRNALARLASRVL